MKPTIYKLILLLFAASLWRCGEPPTSSLEAAEIKYSLARQYTGIGSNVFTIEVPDGADKKYNYSVNSLDVTADVELGRVYPLTSKAINFSYTSEGVHSVDFRVGKANGTPYIFEILAWEFSTERPTPPIISFARTVTRSLSNNLLVSDTRTPTTDAIWLGGDVSTFGKSPVVDGGFWQQMPLTTLVVPVTLTEGDGPKVVEAKFRNAFGNEGAPGIPAEILLKQTPPTDCDAQLIAPIVSNNKISLKLSATDRLPTYYSVLGDVGAVISQKAFRSGEVVTLFVEPSPGLKRLNVAIEDVAGNICLSKDLVVTLDPAFKSERIFVKDHPFWTDAEDVVLDIYFDHFTDQEPLQIKVTGDVSGPNTNAWLPYAPGVAVTLAPTTSGSRRIFAQYKDAAGVESYLIGKRLFLKPAVTVVNAGAPMVSVAASNISGAESLSITGCVEPYAAVAYTEAYPCHPNAAAVVVTYRFSDGSTLVRSATP